MGWWIECDVEFREYFWCCRLSCNVMYDVWFIEEVFRVSVWEWRWEVMS